MAKKDSAQRKCICGSRLFDDNGELCDVCQSKKLYDEAYKKLRDALSPSQKKLFDEWQRLRIEYFDAKWTDCRRSTTSFC